MDLKPPFVANSDPEAPLRRADRWTIQIMPDGGGRLRTLRVSRRAVKAVATGLAVLLLLVAAGLTRVLWDGARSARLARLQVENHQLRGNLHEMQGRLADLSRTIDGLSAREEQFRLVAGLPLIDPEVQAVGVGGPTTTTEAERSFFRADPRVAAQSYAAAFDLDKLVRRADLLAASLRTAVDSAKVHEQLFLSRPSIRPVDRADSWISSPFSHSRYHPILNYSRPHEGIDLSAPEGTPVEATANGRVAFAGVDGGYGRLVEIDHGFGYQTRYAHLSAIRVRVGEKVARGQVIGEVGQTGLATAPNLHYEVRVRGQAVNPKSYLLGDQLLP